MKKNLIALAFGLVLAWLTLEVALRSFPGVLPVEVQRHTGRGHDSVRRLWRDWLQVLAPHPEDGYRHKPNLDVVLRHPDYTYQLRTNADGFRDQLERGDASACAVAVGDSYVYGWGVSMEDTWPEMLEAHWQCPVVNLGVSGYGSERILHSLEDPGWSYTPRLVIWSYFMNDPWEASKFRAWKASGTPDMLTWEREVSRKAGRKTQQLSGVQRFLSRFVTYDLSKWAFKIGQYRSEKIEKLRRRSGNVDMVMGLRWLRHWSMTSHPDYIAGMATTKAALATAQAQAASRNATLLVVLMPPKELVYWPLLSGAQIGFTEADLLRPYADMKALCDELDLLCLDLLPALKARAQTNVQLYFRYDAHANPSGNRVIADAIRKVVTPNRPSQISANP